MTPTLVTKTFCLGGRFRPPPVPIQQDQHNVQRSFYSGFSTGSAEAHSSSPALLVWMRTSEHWRKVISTSWMFFLPANQQFQSNEGKQSINPN